MSGGPGRSNGVAPGVPPGAARCRKVSMRSASGRRRRWVGRQRRSGPAIAAHSATRRREKAGGGPVSRPPRVFGAAAGCCRRGGMLAGRRALELTRGLARASAPKAPGSGLRTQPAGAWKESGRGASPLAAYIAVYAYVAMMTSDVGHIPRGNCATIWQRLLRRARCLRDSTPAHARSAPGAESLVVALSPCGGSRQTGSAVLRRAGGPGRRLRVGGASRQGSGAPPACSVASPSPWGVGARPAAASRWSLASALRPACSRSRARVR